VPVEVAPANEASLHDAQLPGRTQTRLALIGGAAAAPLVAGALIPDDAVGNGPQLCLMRSAFGIPCPFCGGTRAFIEFGHGDSAWFHNFNGFWVIVSIAALLFATIALLATWRSSRAAKAVESRLDRLLAMQYAIPLLLILLAVPGWIWAMTNRSTIV
jgi:hypothetical protein